MTSSEEKIYRAFELLRLAIEYDEGTIQGEDNFGKLLIEDYPHEQVHRLLNSNLEMVSDAVGRFPTGRTAELLRRSVDYISDPEGSHGYPREVAEKIYGVERSK